LPFKAPREVRGTYYLTENSRHLPTARRLTFQSLRNRANLPHGRAAWGCVVLNCLSEQIRELCYRDAEDCARQAANQTDPKLKEDFLDTERRWLFLARSYEVTQRLGDFSDETKQQAAKLRTVIPRKGEAHDSDSIASAGRHRLDDI
jgi:hypothetical protein